MRVRVRKPMGFHTFWTPTRIFLNRLLWPQFKHRLLSDQSELRFQSERGPRKSWWRENCFYSRDAHVLCHALRMAEHNVALRVLRMCASLSAPLERIIILSRMDSALCACVCVRCGRVASVGPSGTRGRQEAGAAGRWAGASDARMRTCSSSERMWPKVTSS